MAQTSGVFPQLSDSTRKHLKAQLVPRRAVRKVAKPTRKVVAPTTPSDARVADSKQFSTPAISTPASLHSRREAARKAGRR